MPDNTFIERSEEKKEREVHGRRHVSRAAILLEKLANIIQCDNKITRYAQIAAIFHDSCRMSDGKDCWESESYYLFTLILEDLFCSEQNLQKEEMITKTPLTTKSMNERIVMQKYLNINPPLL